MRSSRSLTGKLLKLWRQQDGWHDVPCQGSPLTTKACRLWSRATASNSQQSRPTACSGSASSCKISYATRRKTEGVRRSSPRNAPAPAGFHAVVAQAACSLCRGYCCRNGGDEAFLDTRTIGRLRQANPTMTDDALINLYIGRVPVEGYRNSCIFHGRKGCTLDRSMRADVCNTYFCRGLGDYVKSDAAPEPTIVIAGDSEKTRVSQVLTPPRILAEHGPASHRSGSRTSRSDT